MLEKIAKKAIVATVIIVLIMNISNIFDTGFKYYNHFQEKEAVVKKQEQLAISAMLTTMDYKVILAEIRDIYKEVDVVYDKALKSTTSNRKQSDINTYYISLKDSLKKDFKTTIKVASILEMNNEFANSQLTMQEIQESIETIRQYTIANKLHSYNNYIMIKKHIQ